MSQGIEFFSRNINSFQKQNPRLRTELQKILYFAFCWQASFFKQTQWLKSDNLRHFGNSEENQMRPRRDLENSVNIQ